jgi:NAD(P)-dependent dehydrogenase (short-subunit alcohol dehydrogenase family)
MDKPTAIVVGVGAEQGVGGAVCRRFASEGYHVYAAGRTDPRAGKFLNA